MDGETFDRADAGIPAAQISLLAGARTHLTMAARASRGGPLAKVLDHLECAAAFLRAELDKGAAAVPCMVCGEPVPEGTTCDCLDRPDAATCADHLRQVAEELDSLSNAVLDTTIRLVPAANPADDTHQTFADLAELAGAVSQAAEQAQQIAESIDPTPLDRPTPAEPREHAHDVRTRLAALAHDAWINDTRPDDLGELLGPAEPGFPHMTAADDMRLSYWYWRGVGRETSGILVAGQWNAIAETWRVLDVFAAIPSALYPTDR